MEGLSTAFATMRKAGLIARQNFMCCQNCGGYAMATKATEMIDKGKKKEDIKGCVFYHSQDNEHKVKGGNFYLGYGPMHSTKYGDIGLSIKKVGNLVCSVLNIFEVPYEWDGKEGTRILIVQDPNKKD